ncbi:MAG: YdeI/OmpD-associated family protein [Xanthomonadales bacterium]
MPNRFTPDDGLPVVECPDRAAWRAWLERHHAAASGGWLIFWKADSGQAGIAYRDAVLEALCYGWIDGIKRRVDERRYTHRFTPRRARSRWSERNIRYARELIDQGLMRPPGLAAFEQRSRYPAAQRAQRVAAAPSLPAELERAIRANPDSWRNFTALAPGYRKQYVLWLTTAKRADTRERRLREAIRLLASGRKLGMK